jgi:hypothetical protein
MRHAAVMRTTASVLAARAALMLVVATMLVTGIVGGLLRAGVPLAWTEGTAWSGQAVMAHAFLMIGAFMGTVIGVERAVALKGRWPFAAPLCSALAGGLMLAGHARAADGWMVLASVCFLAVNLAVVARQRAAHTALLLTGALAWFIGNLLHALGAPGTAVIPWWFAFLVLTIAAERLEMTRLMRRRRGAPAMLCASLGCLLLGAAASGVSPTWGGGLYGLSLVALACWLVCFDIARRTISAHGLSRYMAICLLTGYAWLAVSGLAWVATSFGLPWRDAALHGLALGFVFSMMLGHAPVILPALTRVKLLFGWFFYVPMAALHLSLLVRLLSGPVSAHLLSAGAAGNAAAMALFAATMAGAAVAWRRKHPTSPRSRHADVAAD